MTLVQLQLIHFITSLLIFPFLLSSTSLSSRASHAPSASSIDYGQIYIAEQVQHEVLPWRLGLNYGYEFGNPYLDVNSTHITMERSLSRYLWIGTQLNLFFSSHTPLMKTFTHDIRISGWSTSLETPIYSAYLITTWMPLAGHLNFLGNYPVEVELGLKAGPGYVAYSTGSGRLGLIWSLRPVVHLTPRWSINAGLGQEIESLFTSSDRLFHFRGELGLSYQL